MDYITGNSLQIGLPESSLFAQNVVAAAADIIENFFHFLLFVINFLLLPVSSHIELIKFLQWFQALTV